MKSADSKMKREMAELKERYGHSQIAAAITRQAKHIDQKLGLGRGPSD